MSISASHMTTSPYGIGLISILEGKRNTVYYDGTGNPTIGVGHLLPAGSDLSVVWTDAEVYAQLAKDLSAAEEAVLKVGALLSQPQFDALVSLTFNIGVGAFGASTVVRELLKVRYAAAADAILMWDSHGLLLKRRQVERGIFIYGSVA